MATFIHDIGQHHIYIDDRKIENLSRDSMRDINKEEDVTLGDHNVQGNVTSVNQSLSYLLTLDVIQGTDSKLYVDSLFNQAKATGKFFVKYEERKRDTDGDDIYFQINRLFIKTPSANSLTQDATADQYTFQFYMSDCPVFMGEVNKEFSNTKI